MPNSAITFNTAGLASATSPGLVGTGAQTFAGKKTLSGGALIAGDVSGSAIATSYIGEMIGTLRSGTNGFTYSSRTTTNPTVGAYGTVLGLTLNKGIWIISFQSTTSCSSTANINYFINCGGTAITQATTQPQYTGTSVFFAASLPVVISADGVAVNLNAQSAANNMSNTYNEGWAIRIA